MIIKKINYPNVNVQYTYCSSVHCTGLTVVQYTVQDCVHLAQVSVNCTVLTVPTEKINGFQLDCITFNENNSK